MLTEWNNSSTTRWGFTSNPPFLSHIAAIIISSPFGCFSSFNCSIKTALKSPKTPINYFCRLENNCNKFCHLTENHNAKCPCVHNENLLEGLSLQVEILFVRLSVCNRFNISNPFVCTSEMRWTKYGQKKLPPKIEIKTKCNLFTSHGHLHFQI